MQNEMQRPAQTLNEQETMSSLQIAEVTGKPHNDVLKAIRAMEPAWVKITQGKFSLSTYTDRSGKSNPCYQLTKTECLYIATKFNDEARARLILRWESWSTECVKSNQSSLEQRDTRDSSSGKRRFVATFAPKTIGQLLICTAVVLATCVR